MFQRWVHLLFLHWKFDPEMVQQTLPRGLTVDTYGGMAWIGIVPFCMRRVRPAVVTFRSSNFLELNLRTYVRDQNGRPGVWFYSLDANHPLAVWTARFLFGLPYQHAKMLVQRRDGEIEYSCHRLGSSPRRHYPFPPSHDLPQPKLGPPKLFLM